MTKAEYEELTRARAEGREIPPPPPRPQPEEEEVSSTPAPPLLGSDDALAEILPRFAPHDRIAIDTEADSLHCYFEKLCLLQISIPGEDFLVDPLAEVNLAPLAQSLADKELVVQGADFDLRLMRRSFGFVASRVFDTVIAARVLGLRQFSLAALVEQYFGVVLTKGSQKANWAQRPLPNRMAEYAINDTHYLLPLAEKLEAQMVEAGRIEWFRQSCERVLQGAGIDRERDQEDLWRISGAGTLRGRAAAVLRALWHWRDQEARTADRPSFHILQNSQLIEAAKSFVAGEEPHFRHMSSRRRREFIAAAQSALALPEEEWPAAPARRGVRATPEAEKRARDLMTRRDKVATELGIEPSFIAPRATLEGIGSDESRAETLVPWQRELLGLTSSVGSPK